MGSFRYDKVQETLQPQCENVWRKKTSVENGFTNIYFDLKFWIKLKKAWKMQQKHLT